MILKIWIKFRETTLFHACLILGFFVVIKYLFLNFAPAGMLVNQSSDFRDFYYPIANRIAEGETLANAHYFEHMGHMPAVASAADGIFVTRFPPGYTVFLAVMIKFANFVEFEPLFLISVVIDFMTLASSLMVYFICKKSFNNSLAAIFASANWIVYPPFLILTKQPNSENLFIFLLLSTVMFLLYQRRSLLQVLCISVLISMSMHVRLAGLFLPIAFGLIIALCDRFAQKNSVGSMYLATIVILAPYLFSLPWIFLVFEETGKLIPMASTGSDLLRTSYSELIRSIPYSSNLWTNGLYEYVYHRATNLDNEVNVLREAHLLLIKLLRALYGTYTNVYDHILALVQLIFLSTAAAGALLSRSGSITKQFHIITTVLFGYFLLTSALGVPLLRYVLPGQVLLSGYIGLFVLWALQFSNIRSLI